MSVPHQCPVCHGSGYVYSQFLRAQDTPCHTCGGRGIVCSPVEPKPCGPWRLQEASTACPGYSYWTGDATPKADGMTA